MKSSAETILRYIPPDASLNAAVRISFFADTKYCTLSLDVLKSGPYQGRTYVLYELDSTIVNCALIPESIVRDGIVRFTSLLDVLDINNWGTAHEYDTRSMDQESLLYLDGESVFLIPRMYSPGSLNNKPYQVFPTGPFKSSTKDELFYHIVCNVAFLALYKGRWVSLRVSNIQGKKHLEIDRAGNSPEYLVLSADDPQYAQTVKSCFEDIRVALFQVKAGGTWYWVSAVYGNNVNNRGCVVFGGKPVPELKITYPGPFEIEWHARYDQIEDVRMLLSNPILEDFFDI